MDHDSRWLPGLDAPPARPQGTISSEHARDAGDACALSRAGCRGHAYAVPYLRRRRRARTNQHRYPRRAQGRRAVADGRSAEHGFAPGPEALSGAAQSHMMMERPSSFGVAPGSRIFARAGALACPGHEIYRVPGEWSEAERDTDLGLARDRQSRARRSGKPDPRGPSAKSEKHIQ